MIKYSDTKFWALVFLILAIIQFLPQIINPNYLFFNQNFFFGIINSNLLAILTSALFLITFIYYARSKKNATHKIPLGLLIAGTFSNILDRLFRGGAVDYISILKWPIFNLADMLIVFGCGLISYNYLNRLKKQK